jgi:hypothetical protein
MLNINGKTFSYTGYSYCAECKSNVIDYLDTAQQTWNCINGHSFNYGNVVKKVDKQETFLFLI